MKQLFLSTSTCLLLLISCVSKKDYASLQERQQETQDLLNSTTLKLNTCLEEKASATTRVTSLEERVHELNEDKKNLIEYKKELIESSKDLTVLTKQGATNLEKSLESLKEKDLKISKLQDALTKKDSVTLAIVTSLKKEVGINDKDIEVNVEKGVVFISLSDKVLFKSGSYNITSRAREILGKVATVINSKPDFEALVEGHTDNVPYSRGVLIDNWDLSAKRSTAIVRELVSLGANPSQLIAAGRSEFVPLVPNDTPQNKSTNRRTKIYVLPKIDQFYTMIEEEMKNLSKVEEN